MATAEALLTAEDYADLPDDGRRTELVRGRIIELTQPSFIHGYVCSTISFFLNAWVRERGLGRIIGNDSGIITERDPDSLRGADVAYYSFARLPREAPLRRYPDVAPDLVIEVRSPSERWRDVHIKVAEYLKIGVTVVCIIDPEPQTARLYSPDLPDRALGPDDELTFPECLPDFRVPIRSLFE